MSLGFSPERARGPEPEIPPDLLVPADLPPEPESKKPAPEPVDFGEGASRQLEQGLKQEGKSEKEKFEIPKEAESQAVELKEIEQEKNIRRVRDWAQREAQSTGTASEAKPKSKSVAKRGVDVTAAASFGLISRLWRWPVFLVRKILGAAGNYVDNLQKKVGGPVNKVIEKLTQSEEEKKK